ncbi:hypothetical protein Q7P37_009153 [Cladosporium fusiforme]
MASPQGEAPWRIVFGILLALRITNALSIKTFFQPDEYFQSLEPAWRIAFGAESGAWITWEWREELRTALHPWIFALVAEDLVIAPKIAQAVFAAGMDFYGWKLGQKIYGLLLTIFSPWQFFTSTRTFANSFETTLTVFALCYWPWEWFMDVPSDGSATIKSPSTSPGWGLHAALAAAAFACILRPTNIIIWATIAGALTLRYSNMARSLVLARNAVIVGSTILAISLLVDGQFYGEWTIPPLRFLYLNIMQDLAIFYGQNRVDYYFTEGLPLLLTTALPFAAIGLWKALRSRSDRSHFTGHVQSQTLHILGLVVVATVVAFSMIAHKEMRFIYPLLPILHILAAKPLADFFQPFPFPRSYLRLSLLLLGVAVNVSIAAYVSTVHQRGVVDVMHYLRHEAETDSGGVRNTTIAFLMPCHSTPWRSHLVHPEISAWALTCEPPIDVALEDRATYLDEADVFYTHPGSWIDNNMQDRKSVFPPAQEQRLAVVEEEAGRRVWPEYLVFFEQLEPVMNAVLEGTRYRECWRGFNSHWHDDHRRRGDVVVQCLR